MRFTTAPAHFVIPNLWDVGSAQILAGLGFKALATSSAASACALGRKDGELARDEALAHACEVQMLEMKELPRHKGAQRVLPVVTPLTYPCLQIYE